MLMVLPFLFMEIPITASVIKDPLGFRHLLNYLYKKYKMPIYCTENGFAVQNESSLPLLDALEDTDRVEYYSGVLDSVMAAVFEDGVDLRAYFPWSFLDNFEWADVSLPHLALSILD